MNLKEFMRTTTQEEFARKMNVTQGAVSHWLRNPEKITAYRCTQIERCTQGAVTRVELRPDIFGPIEPIGSDNGLVA